MHNFNSFRRQLVIIHSTVFLVADLKRSVHMVLTQIVLLFMFALSFILQTVFITQTHTPGITKSIFTFVFIQTSNMSAIITGMNLQTAVKSARTRAKKKINGIHIPATKPYNLFMDIKLDGIFSTGKITHYRNVMHFLFSFTTHIFAY